MKKKFFKPMIVLGFIFSAIISHAQIDKGMKVLRVNAGYAGSSNDRESSFDSNTNKNNAFGLTPSFGYFVTNKLCIGLDVPLSYSALNSDNSYNNSAYSSSTASKEESFQIGLSPYVRYYMQISDKFYCYLTAQAGAHTRKVSSDNSGNSIDYSNNDRYTVNGTSKGNGYSINGGIQLGLTYFVTPKFAIESNVAGLNVNHSYLKTHETSAQTDVTYPFTTTVNSADVITKSNTFNFNFITSAINIGISYYFK